MLEKKALVVCLMGPTAAGKTQLAVNLVEHFPFEIISVDSAMVYRGMVIGTAKPSAAILEKAPHRLIDIRDPLDAYSAAAFQNDVVREIEDIRKRGNIPLLVGGTMLYFSVFQKGLSSLPSANAEIRAKIMHDANELGWPALHERLVQVDTHAAQRIHPHDSQRIQRALEIYELTGKSMTAWQQADAPSQGNYQICNLAVSVDRPILHERIAQRFSDMLAAGFLEEVKQLMARGDLDISMPSIRSVGYRQAWEYLLGNSDYDAMCEKSIIATRQLAKRQLTWLRHGFSDVKWFDGLSANLFLQVQDVINNIVI